VAEILISGGGLAGAAAAIAAALEGSPVRLMERSVRARHKVCGEFLSPDGAAVLDALGAWQDYSAAGPCRIERCLLHLGNRTTGWRLPEAAWGLSRLEFDRLLLERAAALGASISRGAVCRQRASVVATGRSKTAASTDRLFGFKAHFSGPVDDCVTLFFDADGYVGVSGIERSLTNVCGIAHESVLRRYGFDFDAVARRSPRLAERLKPLERRIGWVTTGPLSFPGPSALPGSYPAGDALGFIDPFTGSGMLNALVSGRLAGIAAARGAPPADYLRVCRQLMAPAFRVASLLRRLTSSGLVRRGAFWAPGKLLFRHTRASSGAILRTLEPGAQLFRV
jgi:menaquinone-9 beta-reductase